MGIPQYNKNDVNFLRADLLKMIKQRAHIIWSSELSDIHKVIASNSFINSKAEYFFWSLKFNIDTLKEYDAEIRMTMNKLGAKHTNQMNCTLYLPRSKGGRGLRSLVKTYKEIKMKTAVKLVNDEDKRMKVVAKFHRIHKDTSSYSLLKEAERYTREYEIDLDFSI